MGIVGAQLLKNRGANAFLQPFLQDVMKLMEGVELHVRQRKTTWHGILINCVGDMPASNWLGGFKESGSAASPCRVCHVKKEDMDTVHHEGSCVMRDKETYTKQVEELVNDADLTAAARAELSRDYGINESCCLSVLPYFDPTRAFPHDLMHLLHEGILNLECRLLLEKLLDDRIVNIDRINYKFSRIRHHREFTVPPPILLKEISEQKDKLSFSASEMASLATVLPLVLCEFVSAESNPYYANFLLILKINACLQAYSFNEEQLRSLQSDIFFHNSSFVSLYASRASFHRNVITPKLHGLIHFPSMIRLFGPPRSFWCYRYESKNAPLKKVMRRNCNYRNIPFSLAAQHQKLFGLDARLEGEGNFFNINLSGIQFASCEKVGVPHKASLSRWASHIIGPNLLLSNEAVVEIKTAKIAGRICQAGSIFLKAMPRSNSDLPTFHRIAAILLSDSKEMFIMEDVQTDFYDFDSFSFLVTPQNRFAACPVNEIVFNLPLPSFSVNENIHVTPSYYHIV